MGEDGVGEGPAEFVRGFEGGADTGFGATAGGGDFVGGEQGAATERIEPGAQNAEGVGLVRQFAGEDPKRHRLSLPLLGTSLSQLEWFRPARHVRRHLQRA